MVISLFDEMKCIHRHVECEEDVNRELYELFNSAKSLYQTEVVEHHMKPDVFMDLFISSHQYINCNRACCKNSHEMNLKIIRKLFEEPADESLLNQKLTKDDFLQLVHSRLTSSCPVSDVKHSYLTLDSCFSDIQLEHLAKIALQNNLFQLDEQDDVLKVLSFLFEHKPYTLVHVNHVRNMAILFDALSENKMISGRWQSIIESRGTVLSHHTGKPLTSSSFSSALSKVRKIPTAAYYSIREAVKKMLSLE